MIHPSYNELIEAINENNEENDNAMLINSRYSLVLATSKRARQLISGKEPLVPGAANRKPLSIAIDELYKGKVKILEDNDAEDEDNRYIPETLPADMFSESAKDTEDDFDDEGEENFEEESDEEYDEDASEEDYEDEDDDQE